MLMPVLARLAVALATFARSTTTGASTPPQEAGGRELLQESAVCTQTEYFCGAGDVFEGDVHDALNSPGNCTFESGIQAVGLWLLWYNTLCSQQPTRSELS